MRNHRREKSGVYYSLVESTEKETLTFGNPYITHILPSLSFSNFNSFIGRVTTTALLILMLEFLPSQ